MLLLRLTNKFVCLVLSIYIDFLCHDMHSKNVCEEIKKLSDQIILLRHQRVQRDNRIKILTELHARRAAAR
jgi:hypothetical protein